MSTSNNLDTKMLLLYISGSFQHWGIQHINEQILKLAKKNDQQCTPAMIRLLFDLVTLQIFNYQYTIDELNIRFDSHDQSEMIQIILAHLFEINCPMLVVSEEEHQHQRTVGFNFNSSRYILIACGWVMAVSNFFNKTIQKLVKKKYSQIYQPKALNLANLSKKDAVTTKSVNLYQTAPKIERISYLAKTLKFRKYSVECLIQKRNKIIQRVKNQIKKIDNSLTIEDIFSNTNSAQVEQKQNELRDIILFEKQNMGYRKYWWIWIDQVILSTEYKQLAQLHQTFQKIECPPENIKYSLEIDLNYPRKYVQICHKYKEQMDNISQLLSNMQIKPKKIYKQIDRQIKDQIVRIRQRAIQQQFFIPSFIGMQFKKYMGIGGAVVKEVDGKSLKKQVDKSNKKLRQEIKTFISEIQEIIFI